MQRAAAGSDAFARFVYLSALAGTALLHGLGSPEVEALRTAPGAAQLGDKPVRQASTAGWGGSGWPPCSLSLSARRARQGAGGVGGSRARSAPNRQQGARTQELNSGTLMTRLNTDAFFRPPSWLVQVVQEYLAWAESQLSACGTPAAFAAGAPPSSPFELVAWWVSVSEADIPGLADGSPGRRLLALLDGLFGDNPAAKHMLAGAIGTGAGFIGGLLGAAAQKAIIVGCTAAGTAVGGPIGAMLGMVAGVAVGTLVSAAIGEASKMAGQALTEDLLGSDASVQSTFELGNEVGGARGRAGCRQGAGSSWQGCRTAPLGGWPQELV